MSPVPPTPHSTHAENRLLQVGSGRSCSSTSLGTMTPPGPWGGLPHSPVCHGETHRPAHSPARGEGSLRVPPRVWGVWCAWRRRAERGGTGGFLGLLEQVTPIWGLNTTDTRSLRGLEADVGNQGAGWAASPLKARGGVPPVSPLLAAAVSACPSACRRVSLALASVVMWPLPSVPLSRVSLCLSLARALSLESGTLLTQDDLRTQ